MTECVPDQLIILVDSSSVASFSLLLLLSSSLSVSGLRCLSSARAASCVKENEVAAVIHAVARANADADHDLCLVPTP